MKHIYSVMLLLDEESNFGLRELQPNKLCYGVWE